MDGKYQGLRDISAQTNLVPNCFHALIWTLLRYFGRAKELPGVKELFESRKKEEDEENATHNFYKKFTNQGPAYFGDVDEADGELLKYEEAAEQEGMFAASLSGNLRTQLTKPRAEWEEAQAHLREVLGLPDDTPIPPIPRGTTALSSNIPPPENPPPVTSDGKRKAPDEDSTPVLESDSEPIKRSKPDAPMVTDSVSQADAATTALAHARAAAAYIPFLSAESLLPPKMPTKGEMEGVLLELRKRMLVEEYFGN